MSIGVKSVTNLTDNSPFTYEFSKRLTTDKFAIV